MGYGWRWRYFFHCVASHSVGFGIATGWMGPGLQRIRHDKKHLIINFIYVFIHIELHFLELNCFRLLAVLSGFLLNYIYLVNFYPDFFIFIAICSYS
jgi:hypothetical protein